MLSFERVLLKDYTNTTFSMHVQPKMSSDLICDYLAHGRIPFLGSMRGAVSYCQLHGVRRQLQAETFLVFVIENKLS